MAITRASFEAEKAAREKAEADAKSARQELDTTNKALQRAKAALKHSEALRAQEQARAQELQKRLDAVPVDALAAADEGTYGPRADEPRVMYPADGGCQGRVFANLDAVEAIQAEQPDYWYTGPEEAQARHAALMGEELTDEAAAVQR